MEDGVRGPLLGSAPTTYSILEAAEELGITERRVRQLITEGRLKVQVDGMGRQRLTKAQIERELRRRGRVSVKSLPVPATATERRVGPEGGEDGRLLRALLDAVREGQQQSQEQATRQAQTLEHLAATQEEVLQVLQRLEHALTARRAKGSGSR